ncbi:MAG: tetratricopeptide repeat protein [bacterium]
MSEKETDQSGQVVHGPQVNAGGDVNIGQVGDKVDTGGGDYVARDKIAGDVVVTGYVAGDVVVTYAPVVEVAPPPPLRPPEVDLLVGRDEALAFYEKTLAEAGLAVIGGMAGVGKTALAAVLARRVAPQEAIFWHVFHEGEGLEAVVWRLAGFLATQGHADLWRMLQTTAQTGGRLPPPPLLFDFLIQQLRGRDVVLCFDDFQHVAEDPGLADLVLRLRPLLARAELRLIITTRQIPEFVQLVAFEPLPGLDVQAVRHLLAANDVPLDADIAAQLHHYTGGNPELLTLAVDLLQGAQDAAELVQTLVEAEDVEAFFLDEIEARLTRNERVAMGAVSLLQGYPGSRQAIEAILDGRRLRRVLRDLADRFLLTVTRSDGERLYGQHAIVQDFFYESLNPRERRRMHRRAAEYYRDQEVDRLLSARHFFACGEFAEAADEATADVPALINKGQARQLGHLLARFQETALEPARWLQLQLALGETHAYFGENGPARAAYERALRLVEEEAVGEPVHWYPRICLALGDLLRQEAPQEALEWYGRGLAAGAADDRPLQAALLVGSGAVHMYLEAFEQAQAALQDGLQRLPPGPSQARVSALLNLAVVAAYAEADYDRAIERARQALSMSAELNDHFQCAEITTTLGVFQHMADAWPAALLSFEEALAAAQALGNERMLAQARTNLGNALLFRGEFERAREMLQQALAAARNTHQNLGACQILLNLATLELWAGQHQAARGWLEEAESAVAELSAQFLEADVWRIRALLAIAGGEEDPLPPARRSLALARAVGDPLTEGTSLNVVAQALALAGDHDGAEEAFARSAALLEAAGSFEAAWGRMAWGQSLLAADPARAAALLQEALETFERLGANAARQQTAQLLAQISSV